MFYDWILTADLWCRKQPLYQLSHKHCQNKMFVIILRRECQQIGIWGWISISKQLLQFLQQINVKNIHVAQGAGIPTYNLLIASLLQ